jgi:TetR/AcrR family transcriptional regulator, cholesterol catabolism regulator
LPTVTGATNTNKGKPSGRMEEILACAANLFYKKGYHVTTIEDLANEVGMLKGSLYYYIKSKEDLLYQLLLDVIVAGQTRVNEKIRGIEDPVEQLTVGLEEHIEYIIENQVRVGLFLHEFDVFAGRRKGRIEEEMTKYQKLFVDIVLNGQKQKKFEDLDPWLMVDGFLGMCNWIYRWYPGDKNPSVESVKKTFIAMLLKGIARH